MKLTLAQHRKVKGYTQEEMAEMCGVSRSTYINWEAKPEDLTIRKVMLLAHVLGITLEDFLFCPETLQNEESEARV